MVFDIGRLNPRLKKSKASKQSLEIYSDPEFIEVLEHWGEDHVWKEIQLLMVGRSGKVLDIACGTGITIDIVGKNLALEVHGCDISTLLIDQAIARGISRKLLTVCDATNMAVYKKNSFNHSYSIGSLEHFTEKGITQLIKEAHRITKRYSFHMVPVSTNNKNNGWVEPLQGYYNNSEAWWLKKFKEQYKDVVAIHSCWKDPQSVGVWFICRKDSKK